MLMGSLCESVLEEGHPELGDIGDELIVEVVGGAMDMAMMVLVISSNEGYGSGNMQ